MMPATLHRASSRSNSATAPAIAPTQLSRADRSVAWTSVRTPSARNWAAVSSRPAALTSTTHTSAPARPRANAVARPNPEAAPVTNAALPFMSRALGILALFVRQTFLHTLAHLEHGRLHDRCLGPTAVNGVLQYKFLHFLHRCVPTRHGGIGVSADGSARGRVRHTDESHPAPSPLVESWPHPYLAEHEIDDAAVKVRCDGWRRRKDHDGLEVCTTFGNALLGIPGLFSNGRIVGIRQAEIVGYARHRSVERYAARPAPIHGEL